jgi:SAM-dependent methyltransferase
MAILEVDAFKQASRAMWAAGDYAAVAEAVTDAVAPVLVERVGVAAGQIVLDVATGTGNVALVAAERGAVTVGSDLTSELFDTARRRAADRGVEVSWVEGDAEDLPFPDAGFDRVFSAFGVQFAPRHAVCAAELTRVCRTGGTVVLANWTPEGQVGELLRTIGRYMPSPPDYASPPPLWGSEEHVRALFDCELEFERRTTPVRFDSAEHYVSFMETCYGPMIKARERLTGEGSWDGCRSELVEMMERRNEATDGTLYVPAEYALIVARP